GVLHRHGLVDADSGQANRLDEDVLLVEGGQELSAEPRGKNAAQDDEGGGRSENQSRMSKGPTQHRQIGMPNTPDQWTFELRQATTEEQRGHGLDEGEGQKQGPGQREQSHSRQGSEHPSFDASQTPGSAGTR